VLLQGYQTLVREIASPTLPSFITACLQLINPPKSTKPTGVPASFISTVTSSLARLIPLFPTTLRPFSAQITTALRGYVAPTTCDAVTVPHGLRETARRVLILLHYTAPKNGNSDEWARRIRNTIRDCHATADQVFRAVQESWVSTAGYRSEPIRPEVEPSGGGDAAEEFPSWSGVGAGAERLVGVLEFLAEHLKTATKTPVTVPIGEILDLTSRVSLVAPPSSEDSAGLNSAIGREEKAELWSFLPDIHGAAISLHIALIARLGDNALSFCTDIIDQQVRILSSSRHVPAVRLSAYLLTKELLLLCGPALPKLTVESIIPLIHTCCQDTLKPTGYGEPTPQEAPATNAGTKQKDPASSNADAFLPGTAAATTAVSIDSLRVAHEAAAYDLLPTLLSHLPQKHLSPESRALLDRTAILSKSKEAMLASCLHPYKDSRGRYYPSILPFLVRQYPHDQGVEVLRTNLMRSAPVAGASHTHEQSWTDPRERLDELLKEKKLEADSADSDTAMDDVAAEGEQRKEEQTGGAPLITTSGWGFQVSDSNKMNVDPAPAAAATNAFFTAEPSVITTTSNGEQSHKDVPLSPLKRKASQVEPGKPKRVDTGKAPDGAPAAVAVHTKADSGGDDDSDSDSGESIQIDMTFDDEEEEEEDEEEEEEEEEGDGEIK